MVHMRNAIEPDGHMTSFPMGFRSLMRSVDIENADSDLQSHPETG